MEVYSPAATKIPAFNSLFQLNDPARNSTLSGKGSSTDGFQTQGIVGRVEGGVKGGFPGVVRRGLGLSGVVSRQDGWTKMEYSVNDLKSSSVGL